VGRRKSRRYLKTCVVSSCAKLACRKGQLCQMHSWRLRLHGDVNWIRPSTCRVENCQGKYKAKNLCETHYQRFRKYGSTEAREHPRLAAHRYRQVVRRGHPLACKTTERVLEHRLVMFEAIGFGRVACVWCGKPIAFKLGLVVDHLDHNRQNNIETNLLPSCVSCNSARRLGAKPLKLIYEEVGS
jgi:uncharacterized Zn-finger protein